MLPSHSRSIRAFVVSYSSNLGPGYIQCIAGARPPSSEVATRAAHKANHTLVATHQFIKKQQMSLVRNAIFTFRSCISFSLHKGQLSDAVDEPGGLLFVCPRSNQGPLLARIRRGRAIGLTICASAVNMLLTQFDKLVCYNTEGPLNTNYTLSSIWA